MSSLLTQRADFVGRNVYQFNNEPAIEQALVKSFF